VCSSDLEANKALKQAGATLRVVKVKNVPAGQGGDNGNGNFTGDERDDIRKNGGDELDSLANEKGIKICFGNIIESADPGNPGISVHTNPTIMVKAGRPADSTGQTIAHECGHVMTLGSGHKIDATTNASDGGHAPNVPGGSGAGNLMAPSNYRSGTNLTPDQIAEMEQWKKDHGKTAEQFDSLYPATKLTQQFGNGSDPIRDMFPFPSFFDLDQVFLSSFLNLDTVKINFLIAGVIPPTGSYQVMYNLGLDIDHVPATGIMYAGLQGVDRIVTVQVISNFGVINSLATVRNTVTNLFSTISVPPQFHTELEFYDINKPGVPKESSLSVKIPKILLNLVASEVPAVATTGLGGDVTDVLYFAFDTFRWMNDATLQLYGTGLPVPGSMYPFSVSGLIPNSFFDVFVDDLMVFNGTLNPSGAYSGNFIFPTSKSAVDVHYLAVQDNSGEFAYNISSPRTPVWILPATTISTGQNKCFDASQTISAGGGPSSLFEVMPGGSANMIAGHNIFLREGVDVFSGGYLHAYITSNGSYCGSSGPPSAPVNLTGVESHPQLAVSLVKVYPNPTTGDFTLELPTEFANIPVHVEVYSMLGRLVLSQSNTGNVTRVFSLSEQPAGIYIIRVIAENRVVTVKIIKQ
jgi:hypothetical protein